MGNRGLIVRRWRAVVAEEHLGALKGGDGAARARDGGARAAAAVVGYFQ
jgi:hypothetical protein